MGDYKKKYEQALENFKKIKDANKDNNELVNFIEYEYPELKESEDERIRKWLIEMVEVLRKANPTNADHNGNCSDAIAWLEKQGEHANFRNKIQIGDEVTRNEDGALVNLSQFKRMVKQGEQKSLNKVEQEDVELTDFESALFSAFSDAWQEYLSGKEVNVAKWAREHSAELLEVAIEQKPTWNERDENEYNHTLKILKLVAVEQETNGYNNLIGSIDWLKSLKERMKGE